MEWTECLPPSETNTYVVYLEMNWNIFIGLRMVSPDLVVGKKEKKKGVVDDPS